MKIFDNIMKKASGEWKGESDQEHDGIPLGGSTSNSEGYASNSLVEEPAALVGHSYGSLPGKEQQLPEKRPDGNANAPLRSGGSGSRKKSSGLPPLSLYIEAGNFRRASERARKHPGEVKAWAPIPIKSSPRSFGSDGKTLKRLALHHACLKLRAASGSRKTMDEDPFVELCRLILLLIELYPRACAERETRHGCMPLHLVAFASCAGPSERARGASATDNHHGSGSVNAPRVLSPSSSTFSTSALSSALPSPASHCEPRNSPSKLSRPVILSHNQRSVSEGTAATQRTTMSVAIAEEKYTGIQSEYHELQQQHQGGQPQIQSQSVSMGNNVFVSAEREEWAVKVVNALLDAFPRAIKMSSEGGRLPLHWAAAGRATPRVVSTLITAYPDAAKHRNKDGCLPVHLCAHWGISHSAVVVSMLRSYPDATYGKNRWERSPLEEALCMAGENGRPHQAVLVRALRKHHSHWTRPEGVLFHQPQISRRDPMRNLVDTDETVDSMENSFVDAEAIYEDSLFRDERGAYGKPPPKNGLQEFDLQTLIVQQNWESVAHRLDSSPTEARVSLRVPTRGGFTSSSGFAPLHSACENIPPKEIVEKMIHLHPEVVTQRFMPGGKLPLHVACTWHAPKESIDVLLAANRNACKIPDELGNLPLHLACFSGAPPAVVEILLKAYPKAVLYRNNQGSLAEDITKRLKHDSRTLSISLLHLCRDEVNRKRQMKHRRNRSDGYIHSAQEGAVMHSRDSQVNPTHYLIDHCESEEIEVTYSGESEAKKELVWI